MYRQFEEVSSAFQCTAVLTNANLWKSFHQIGTEMIITKTGRRMFPSLQVQLSDLEPQTYYCIFVEMVPAAKCRYKYNTASGWAPAGSEEVQSPHRLYMHPDGVAKGEHWMSQPVNFVRLKLTNTPAPPSGQIVLSSMHQYQPRIIVVQSRDPRALGWAPSASIVFPEAKFIAVTAYQNEQVTALKINHNPFAKGFRQNGQAKCKRKRHHSVEVSSGPSSSSTVETEEEEEIFVVDEGTNSTEPVAEIPAVSPVEPPAPWPHYYYPQSYYYPWYYRPDHYYPSAHIFPYPGFQFRQRNPTYRIPDRDPKDFSIKALLGT